MIIKVRKDIADDLGLDGFLPIEDELCLDGILGEYAYREDVTAALKDDGRGFKLAAFAYATFGEEEVLTVARESLSASVEGRLGFGRPCQVHLNGDKWSPKDAVIEDLHNELDQFFRSASCDTRPCRLPCAYDIAFAGLLYGADRPYDRGNLGCLFHVRLHERFPAIPVVSTNRRVFLQAASSIAPESLGGWSRLIHANWASLLSPAKRRDAQSRRDGLAKMEADRVERLRLSLAKK